VKCLFEDDVIPAKAGISLFFFCLAHDEAFKAGRFRLSPE
jgi:hypothetical protein